MTDQYKASVPTGKPAAPDGADELREAGIAAIGRGEWQQALNDLLEAHRRRPTGPFIRLHLARVLLELGRTEEALPHLDTVAANPFLPGLEPMLSELQARAKTALQDATVASAKNQSGLLSRLKKLFAKR